MNVDKRQESNPNPQVAMALSALKPVVVQVKPILTFHPSGAAENVQNRFPTHVKNFACGLGSKTKANADELAALRTAGFVKRLFIPRLKSRDVLSHCRKGRPEGRSRIFCFLLRSPCRRAFIVRSGGIFPEPRPP